MDEDTQFNLSTIGVVVGLAIMLVGVYQTSGQSLNAPQILGGAVVVVSVGLLTHGIIQLDEDHAAE